MCTHWGSQENPIKIYFSLKFSALKNIASQKLSAFSYGLGARNVRTEAHV